MAKYKLGDIAPIRQGAGSDEFPCWLLNLDMVESNTGRIIEYLYVQSDEIGASTVAFDTSNVLYSKLRPYLNKVVLPDRPGFATSEMLPLMPDTAIITREYLTHFLRSPRFVGYINEKTSGAKMPRANTADLRAAEIDCPSIEQQTSIVGILERLTQIIELRQRQLRTLDTLIKARFVEMFGECSKTVSIGTSGLTISDGNYSSKYPRSDEFVERGIPFIRANNMRSGTIIDDDMYYITPEKHSILLKGHLKANDILVSTRGNIGIIALVPDRHTDSNINAQIVLLRDEVGRFIPHYLLWALQTESVKTQFTRLQTGTALKQLPVGRLEQVVIQEPPLSEQQVFSDFAKQVDKSKATIQSALQKTQTLFDSLMQQYFG